MTSTARQGVAGATGWAALFAAPPTSNNSAAKTHPPLPYLARWTPGPFVHRNLRS